MTGIWQLRRLAEKTVVAWIDRSEAFHEKWEAEIQSKYDPEKIGLRILNRDGGSWVHDECDAINVHLPILDSTNHRTVKVFKRLIY